MILRTLPAGIVAALILAACGGSPASTTAGTPAPTASPTVVAATAEAGSSVPVTLSDFMLMPSALTAKAGSVSFTVRNAGPTVHNLTIRDSTGKVVGATANLKPGESATLTVTLGAGAYTAICSLAGHESLGMKDPLTVS